MKIIFAGTPEFAVPTLQALIESTHDVVAVYTQPDRPAGRGREVTMSPVKTLALQHQIPVCQPNTLKDNASQQELAAWQADLMIVVAYGMILPKAALDIPKYGCINIHGSLLPRWRGAAPIQRALLAGDIETGVSIMQMDEGLDTGPVYTMQTCPIHATDTAHVIHDKLAALGAKTLLPVLEQLPNQALQAQATTGATYATKLNKAEAKINWNDSALQIERQIRAFNPWPIAYFDYNNQMIRVWQAEVIFQPSTSKPGTIVKADREGVDIATGKSILRLLIIQLPGGRALKISELLNGKPNFFDKNL